MHRRPPLKVSAGAVANVDRGGGDVPALARKVLKPADSRHRGRGWKSAMIRSRPRVRQGTTGHTTKQPSLYVMYVPAKQAARIPKGVRAAVPDAPQEPRRLVRRRAVLRVAPRPCRGARRENTVRVGLVLPAAPARHLLGSTRAFASQARLETGSWIVCSAVSSERARDAYVPGAAYCLRATIPVSAVALRTKRLGGEGDVGARQ